jgi:hypothetical protein
MPASTMNTRAAQDEARSLFIFDLGFTIYGFPARLVSHESHELPRMKTRNFNHGFHGFHGWGQRQVRSPKQIQTGEIGKSCGVSLTNGCFIGFYP